MLDLTILMLDLYNIELKFHMYPSECYKSMLEVLLLHQSVETRQELNEN